MQTLIENKIEETFQTVQVAIQCTQYSEAKEALDELIKEPFFPKENEQIQLSVFQKYQEYYNQLVEINVDLHEIIQQIEDSIKILNNTPTLQHLKQHFLQLKQELFFKAAVKIYHEKNNHLALNYYQEYLTLYTEDLERRNLETVPDEDAEKILTAYFRTGEMLLKSDIDSAKQYYRVAITIFERVQNLISNDLAEQLLSVNEQLKSIDEGADVQILLTRQQDDSKKQEVINLLKNAMTSYLRANKKGVLTVKSINGLTCPDIKKIVMSLCSSEITSDKKNSQIKIVSGEVKIFDDCAKFLVEEYGKDLLQNLNQEKPTYKKLSEEGVIDLTISKRPMNGHEEFIEKENHKKRKMTENGVKPIGNEELDKALHCDLESKPVPILKTLESYLLDQKEQLIKENLVTEILELQDKLVQIDKQLISATHS